MSVSYEFQQLADYNAEVNRGLMHTDEWKAKMAVEQRRFNKKQYRTETPEPGKCCAAAQRAERDTEMIGLRARIASLEAAMIDPRPLAKAWWSGHSSPFSNAFDFLPIENQQRCMLEALEELAQSTAETNALQTQKG